MPKLCADVILGQDFMRLHNSISFKLNGHMEPLEICCLIPMTIEPPRLFRYLTQNCQPASAPSRRYSSEDRNFIRSETESLLASGIIESSTSPWRAQVLVTKSSNHKKRLVIDYSQTINRYTQLDAYPLPLIENLVHDISQFSVFSMLDLKSAYHQIPIRQDEKLYTAFEANNRLYQFTRVPFGLTNAVAAFQRIMNDIISSHKLEGTFSYLDDLIVAGKTTEEHDRNLEKFLECTKILNISLNENKCQWRQKSINFLGHTISCGQVKPDKERLEPLRQLPPPHDSASLRRTVGLFSYYSK
jgi:transposase InsO family protein